VERAQADERIISDVEGAILLTPVNERSVFLVEIFQAENFEVLVQPVEEVAIADQTRNILLRDFGLDAVDFFLLLFDLSCKRQVQRAIVGYSSSLVLRLSAMPI
jgi:hypothetical protein